MIPCPFYSFHHLSVSQIEDAYSGLMYGDDTTLVFNEPTTERLDSYSSTICAFQVPHLVRYRLVDGVKKNTNMERVLSKMRRQSKLLKDCIHSIVIEKLFNRSKFILLRLSKSRYV